MPHLKPALLVLAALSAAAFTAWRRAVGRLAERSSAPPVDLQNWAGEGGGLPDGGPGSGLEGAL